MDEIKRTIQINPQQEAYKGFFCYKWKASFLGLVRHSRLREPGYDLARTWEAISNVRQLPWGFAESVDRIMCQSIKTMVPQGLQLIIKYFEENLIPKLEAFGEQIRRMLRKRITQAIKEISEEIDIASSAVAVKTIEKRDDIWEGLIAHKDFHSSLWGLERLCYGGLYYSYEWYLTQCLRIKRGEPEYRWYRVRGFIKDFRAAFGNTLTASCLEDDEIDLARIVRNSLAHAGGRITTELNGRQHTFRIENGEIQINAEHTTSLYHKLKDRAVELTQSAVGMPEFQ